MKNFLFSLCLTGACVAFFAQTVSAETGPDTVSVEFTVLGWSGEIKDLGYKTGGSLKPLQIPAYVRSPVFKYAGPATMDLYSMDAPSSDKPKVVGTVTFTPGAKRFTVLIGSNGGGGYVTGAAVDDTDKFPLGHARFCNLTPVKVLMRLNKKNITILEAGKMEIVAPREDQMILVTETAFDRNGTWVRANDDFVGVPPDMQTSVFFLSSTDAHFKSLDGVARAMQMVILRDKPVQTASEKNGG